MPLVSYLISIRYINGILNSVLHATCLYLLPNESSDSEGVGDKAGSSSILFISSKFHLGVFEINCIDTGTSPPHAVLGPRLDGRVVNLKSCARSTPLIESLRVFITYE